MTGEEIITPNEYHRQKKGMDEADRRRKEEIKRLYNKGKTQEEIAEHFGISVSYVNLILKGKR